MKRLILVLSLIICQLSWSPAEAQNVTRTRHQAALTTDAVSTGTLTIRKPDYICISTDEGRNQLQMDGTKFTMIMEDLYRPQVKSILVNIPVYIRMLKEIQD